MTADETLARLERLERDHRRLRTGVLIGGVVLVGATLGVIECFRERSDLFRYGLDAASVTIHDQSERRVGLLGEFQDRAYLKFNDTSGKERMFLAQEADGMVFTMSDPDGHPRVRISVKQYAVGIEILDVEGKRVWSAP
jgi:hypothetical protein